jgi:hypothetical protein
MTAKLLNALPAPNQSSASVKTFASLSIQTGVSKCVENILPRGVSKSSRSGDHETTPVV